MCDTLSSLELNPCRQLHRHPVAQAQLPVFPLPPRENRPLAVRVFAERYCMRLAAAHGHAGPRRMPGAPQSPLCTEAPQLLSGRELKNKRMRL